MDRLILNRTLPLDGDVCQRAYAEGIQKADKEWVEWVEGCKLHQHKGHTLLTIDIDEWQERKKEVGL